MVFQRFGLFPHKTVLKMWAGLEFRVKNLKIKKIAMEK